MGVTHDDGARHLVKRNTISGSYKGGRRRFGLFVDKLRHKEYQRRSEVRFSYKRLYMGLDQAKSTWRQDLMEFEKLLRLGVFI